MLDDTQLALQAPLTAHTWLAAAIRRINEELGEGYAQAHPELVAAFMHTAAIDYATTSLSNRLTEGFGLLADALRDK